MFTICSVAEYRGVRNLPQQLALDFEQPLAHDFVFFALMPPCEIAPKIVELAKRSRNDFGLRGTQFAPDRLHISLHGFGPYPGLPSAVVDRATTAAASINTPSFDVVFDRVVSFWSRKSRRPFVLRAGGDVIALSAFHETLGVALGQTGLRASAHFTPHMTLLYDRLMVPEHEIETVRWTVRDFVLIHSLQGQSRYIELGRWPLQA